MANSVLTRPNQSSQLTYQTVNFANTQYVQVDNVLSIPFVKILLDAWTHTAVFNEHEFNEIVFNGDEQVVDDFIKFTHVYDITNKQLLIGFDENHSGTLLYTY